MHKRDMYLKSTYPFYLFIYIYRKEKNNKFYQVIDISIITSIFMLVNKIIFLKLGIIYIKLHINKYN